jgi:aspartate/methionine/tyrosine aminotransferase
MKRFAQIPANMPRSGIRMIMDRSAQVADCIHLEVGQPDMPTPPHIIDALCSYARKGHTTYGPNAGVNELRDAAARYFERKTGVPTKRQNIVSTIGAVGSCATAFMALCEAGDEVLLPDPAWPNYGMAATALHAKVVNYSLRPDNDYQPDFYELETLVSARTKLLFVCSPSNPTGQVYDSDTMAQLMAFCRRHDLYLLSDEIYSEICFDAEHASALPHDTDERALIISGVSKSYAMTGFRVGFTRASEAYVELATKLQEPMVSCGSPFSQLAAAVALDGPQDCVAEMVAVYKRRRDLAVDILRRGGLHRYTPGGAFYVLVDVSASGLDGQAFALKLLDEKSVAVAPGTTFGQLARDQVRISLAASDDSIRQGLERICTLIDELKGS